MAGVLIFVFAAYFFHSKKDYSGMYKKISAACPDVFIEVKRLQGFGDKYYFISIYKVPGKQLEWELQWILQDKAMVINSLTKRGDSVLDMSEEITFDGNSLKINLNGNLCMYSQID